MKQKTYTILAVLLAVIVIAWKLFGEVMRRYNERVYLKLQDGAEVALSYPSPGSYTFGVVEPWQMYGNALELQGAWCRITQGSRVCYEGEVSGIKRFTADNVREDPVVIKVKIRENADLFSKCYLVIGQPP